MKGIVLAAGLGTRLHPATIPTVKQLLPVYDKPMIYYPISVLMLAGIKDILIISNPKDLEPMKALFADKNIGVNFEFATQEEPRGIADAFRIGKDFIGSSPVCLILGDNIFHASGLRNLLKNIKDEWVGSPMLGPAKGATIFGYRVPDPERFGVVEFEKNGWTVKSIEEKPANPKSNLAVPGLYFYDNRVVKYAEDLRPSDRGELEITDINNIYLENEELYAKELPRGTAWLDTGTFDSLLKASNFVQTMEEMQDFKIGCIEEIAFRNGWISSADMIKIAKDLEKSGYGNYLYKIVNESTDKSPHYFDI